MKRRNIAMIIVSLAIFIVLVISATYAYFASNTNTGNGLDFSTTLDDNNIAFTATSGTLSLHVAAENMLESQISEGDVIAAESTGTENIIVSLSSNTETPIACTYNVYFEWNNGEAYLNPTNANKNEFTLELELQDSDGTGSEGNNKFAAETQLTRVITSANKTLIVEGATIVGSSTDSGSQTWVPTAKFYNLTDDQSALAGATFGGKFTIEDVECNVKVGQTLSETVIGLASEEEYTSSQISYEEVWIEGPEDSGYYEEIEYYSKYIVKQESVSYEGTTYDAGIRYKGENPDNYVQFNGDEEWRIIGVFEGSTIGLEPGKWYTKIIKSSSIGQMEWDDYENDWTNSTLNQYLNNEYVNSIDSTKIAQYNGKYSTWYLRSTVDAFHAGDMYISERITGSVGYRDDEPESADATIESAIAIMYMSDYHYTKYNEGYGWLEIYDEEVWQITPDSNEYSRAAFDGAVFDDVYNTRGIRPTLYLEHDVKIAEGNGSQANPYKLS